MALTPAQLAQIDDCLSTQRGDVSLTNLQVINAILLLNHAPNWPTVAQFWT